MTINELNDIADRIDQLASNAWGFNWSAEQIIAEMRDYADRIRDEADEQAERLAALLEEQANEHDYYKQFA